jgi:hypothetical protein
MHSLQKEGRTALLEMPPFSLLANHPSCHQRRAARTKKRRAHQIRPMGSGDRLREATWAFSLQKLLLNPKLQAPDPLLCHLRQATPLREAPDRPGMLESTLKSGREDKEGEGKRLALKEHGVDQLL